MPRRKHNDKGPAPSTVPGVYLEEIREGVPRIEGVPVSIAGFAGFFSKGPMNTARRLLSSGEFEREYGGLRPDSLASYAIAQFFLNGGREAWVVRTAAPDAESGPVQAASVDLTDRRGRPAFRVRASSPGAWGGSLRVDVDHDAALPGGVFHLTVSEVAAGTVASAESFHHVSAARDDARYAPDVVNAASRLVRLEAVADPASRPKAGRYDFADGGVAGRDGAVPGVRELIDALAAFDAVDLVNILCLPDTDRLTDAEAFQVISAATAYAAARRAFLIVDPPYPDALRHETSEIKAWLETHAALRHPNVAAYFPRPMIADPLDGFRLRAVPASGTIAGLYARIDAVRGVWKAPSGLEAVLRGVLRLERALTGAEIEALNPIAMNCLCSVPPAGNVCWGSRTLAGADRLASEWKYVPVRRTALFLEESLERGTRFAVFEPNGEPLWSRLRQSVTTFMQDLFRQGAFQGATSREAYFVRCDGGTTSPADIDNGIVNVVVGFAPLKPAEFVILKVRQAARPLRED